MSVHILEFESISFRAIEDRMQINGKIVVLGLEYSEEPSLRV